PRAFVCDVPQPCAGAAPKRARQAWRGAAVRRKNTSPGAHAEHNARRTPKAGFAAHGAGRRKVSAMRKPLRGCVGRPGSEPPRLWAGGSGLWCGV
ncbi:hypothetical protein BO998_25935, partial [Citrobacter werkmanii]